MASGLATLRDYARVENLTRPTFGVRQCSDAPLCDAARHEYSNSFDVEPRRRAAAPRSGDSGMRFTRRNPRVPPESNREAPATGFVQPMKTDLFVSYAHV